MKKSLACAISVVLILATILFFAGCGDDPKKQEAIEAYNAAVDVFQDTADLINENFGLIGEESITVFQQVSDTIATYRSVPEGDDEITDAQYDEIIEFVESAKDWSLTAKAQIEAGLADIEG